MTATAADAAAATTTFVFVYPEYFPKITLQWLGQVRWRSAKEEP